MKWQPYSLLIVFSTIIPGLISIACNKQRDTVRDFNPEDMMIRVAEIEIDSQYLDDYIAILQEEAAASVQLEPGVISIFPMYVRSQPAQVKIMEIYTGREAYESHLATTHFQKYKTTTQHMVKSLNLLDMKAIDPQSMDQIFAKFTWSDR